MAEPRAAFDAVVVGGGPAGLSAALVLGRCVRRVLLVDGGRYRNAASRAVHAFLTRDGTPPTELRRRGREELRRYAVRVLEDEVVRAVAGDGGFALRVAGGAEVRCRKLVLATGVVDELPALPGLAEHFGRSAFLCPYCDGWEVRGLPLGVHGRGGAELALALRGWSRDVVLFAEGPVAGDDARALAAAGVGLVEVQVRRLVGVGGRLEQVELADGSSVARRALFLKLAAGRRRSRLAEQLGLDTDARGGIVHDEQGHTSRPGVFVAGDASRDLLLAIVAAAEGAAAAVAVNAELGREDRTAERPNFGQEPR
jgi:thioredoxin reductase